MLQEEKQMANIIDGKAVSAQVKEGIRQEVEALKAKGIEIGLVDRRGQCTEDNRLNKFFHAILRKPKFSFYQFLI